MTWQTFYAQYLNMEPGLMQIALRLGCAMLVGTLIGLEREYTHRPAGLRTHILVTLGACVAAIMGQMLLAQYGGSSDPARLSAQVITGVGFLGAGTILKEGASVKGLTTAASVWAVACLGIAAGYGYYALAILGMLCILFTLTLLEWLQQRFIHTGGDRERFLVTAENVAEALTGLHALCQKENVILDELSVRKLGAQHEIEFRATFYGRRHKKHHTRFVTALVALEGVTAVENRGETASVSK